MSNMKRARRFEYRVKRRLEAEGYIVFRLLGSRPVDLIAFKNGEILLVECKVSRGIGEKQKERLQKLADEIGAELILATKKKNRIAFIKIK